LNQQARQVIFIISSMVILFGWMFFMPTPAPPPSKGSSPITQSSNAPPKTPQQGIKESSSAGAVKAVHARRTASVPAAEFKIETDQYIATFSNEGAILTGFQLKKYLDRYTQKPIQLVNQDPTHPKPFFVSYAPLPDLNQKIFEAEGSSKKLAKGEKAKLVFRYADANGTVLEKTFGFKNGSHLIEFEMAVAKTGKGSIPASDLAVEWSDSLGVEENTGTPLQSSGHRVAILTGGEIEFEASKKSQEARGPIPGIGWVALTNQFFVAALIPDPSSGGASAKVVRDFNAYKSPTPEEPNPGIDPKVFAARPLLLFAGQALRSGESFKRSGSVFFGPQDYSVLKEIHLGLERVVDFGMFGFISVYMLELLKWFHKWFNSWGLAIIFLSIAVKLLLWLPTHSSYKKMYQTQQKMKELQPKLEAIKRKYADNKQEQQKQTMALYQTAGINPMGGCLPMLLQMPIFFALYSTLSHSIELRGASFLWASDLTLKDPIYVLPLLMGASMIAQMKVSGQMSTQTAGQQKFMMWFFPIFLTFISFEWPAGLLVYWVVTNVLSMLQQKEVNREIQNAKKKEEVLRS
jgi:YidC/Oxa1 family membrane protein insertase